MLANDFGWVWILSMETTLALEAPKTGLIVQKNDNVEVTASTPDEMAASQTALIQWCDSKIATIKAEATELLADYEAAKAKKWKTSTLRKHANLADLRVTFYMKLKKALELGYMIVPNFPVSLFALRTLKDDPKRNPVYTTWNHHPGDFEQKTETLPDGVGEYKNPFPAVRNIDYTMAESKQKNIHSCADSWRELEFPLTMAKAHIIEAVNRSMAIKLFDDFGILPAAHIKRDPLIVARLKDPRSTKYNERYVSFIVAWHLDTKVL